MAKRVNGSQSPAAMKRAADRYKASIEKHYAASKAAKKGQTTMAKKANKGTVRSAFKGQSAANMTKAVKGNVKAGAVLGPKPMRAPRPGDKKFIGPVRPKAGPGSKGGSGGKG